jgi:hypothetical protein
MAIGAPAARGGCLEVVMGTINLDRRRVLKGLGVGALAGAAATLSPMTALADDDSSNPLGAWNINIHEGVQPSRQAVVSFAAGGAFTTVDSLGPGAVGVGAWGKREGKGFAFKFTVFDFSQGSPAPVVVAGNGTVSENSIRATFSVTVFGNNVGGGTVDGTRITA